MRLKCILNSGIAVAMLSPGGGVYAQTPELSHVFDIRAEISAPLNGGDVPYGRRTVIPITGGEVTGKIVGTIIPGGADYQITDTLRNRTELKAIYSIKGDDGTIINVVNEGIIHDGMKDSSRHDGMKDSRLDGTEGGPTASGTYYFMTSPKFECDLNSKYAWLNNRIFVCRPVGFEDGAIVLRVWVAE